MAIKSLKHKNVCHSRQKAKQSAFVFVKFLQSFRHKKKCTCTYKYAFILKKCC